MCCSTLYFTLYVTHILDNASSVTNIKISETVRQEKENRKSTVRVFGLLENLCSLQKIPKRKVNFPVRKSSMQFCKKSNYRYADRGQKKKIEAFGMP